jgi:hypothetical protein
MNAFHDLQKTYLMALAGIGSTLACIDWGITRLEMNEESNDPDVLSLPLLSNTPHR